MRFLTAAAIALACAARGETLDRIAVAIEKHVITESEVLRDLRVSAFIDQKPPDLSGASKRKAADRLIDQYLILQEAALSHITLLTVAETQAPLDHLKAQYGADYQAALARYFITEQDVIDQLAEGLRTLRFTDLRFRPEIQLSTDDLTDFYNTLVQGWKRENRSPIPSFEESRDTVEKLLTDQRTMQSLDRWLGATRTETKIRYRDEVFK